MSDVSKIKLPDESVLNIKDYRIPGVDTEPTSGSDNVVTSGGVYKDIEDISLVTSASLNDLNDRLVDIEKDGITTEEFSQIENVLRDTYTKTEVDRMFSDIEETDPIFTASAAANITSSDITNGNNKTSNTGTVTGVKVNGTTNSPVSGVVDVGTIVTGITVNSTAITITNGIAAITTIDIEYYTNNEIDTILTENG